MTIDKTLDVGQMKEKALQMGSYYYKGLGNALSNLVIEADLYLMNPDETENVESAYACLQRFEDFYSQIPFEELHGREEFYPLFIVRRFLPRLKNEMDELFKEQVKTNSRDLFDFVNSIINVGRLYWGELEDLVNEVRTLPEGKGFKVEVKKYPEGVWVF